MKDNDTKIFGKSNPLVAISETFQSALILWHNRTYLTGAYSG